MTPSEFQALFADGDFDTLDGSYIQKFLTMAVPMFNVSRWGSFYSEGLANYVAHSIVMSKQRATRAMQPDSGNVSEQHVGPVGESFDNELLMRQAEDTYMRSDYGQRYCELRDLVGLGGVA